MEKELPIPTDIKLRGRKVLVTAKFPTPDGKSETKEIEAKFHVWGFRKMKSADPKIANMETIGIVEFDDGKIRMITPEKVRFLDKGY